MTARDLHDPRDQPLMHEWARAINAYSNDLAARQQAENAHAFQEAQATARRRAMLQDIDLVAALKSEEVERLLSQRAELERQIAELRAQASAAAESRVSAELAWEQATEHTLVDAQLLQTLRDEAPRLAARMPPLELELVAIEEQLARLRGAHEEQRRRALAEELWPPIAQRLVAWVRAGLPLLAEQAAARQELYAAGAWPFIRGDELIFAGRYGPDELVERLTTWLARAERVGYGATQPAADMADVEPPAPPESHEKRAKREQRDKE